MTETTHTTITRGRAIALAAALAVTAATAAAAVGGLRHVQLQAGQANAHSAPVPAAIVPARAEVDD